jgi:hypothetical protein
VNLVQCHNGEVVQQQIRFASPPRFITRPLQCVIRGCAAYRQVYGFFKTLPCNNCQIESSLSWNKKTTNTHPGFDLSNLAPFAGVRSAPANGAGFSSALRR